MVVKISKRYSFYIFFFATKLLLLYRLRGRYVTCMLVFLTLNMSRSFGVITCTFLKKTSITQKRLVVERNGSWVSGVYVACMLVFLTLSMSRSFGIILCTFRKKERNSKAAHRREKWTQILPLGCMHVACVLTFLTLNMSRSVEVIR